jgi:hypothetical protein
MRNVRVAAFYLPAPLRIALLKASKESGLSQSEIVRVALVKHLHVKEPGEVRVSKPSAKALKISEIKAG